MTTPPIITSNEGRDNKSSVSTATRSSLTKIVESMVSTASNFKPTTTEANSHDASFDNKGKELGQQATDAYSSIIKMEDIIRNTTTTTATNNESITTSMEARKVAPILINMSEMTIQCLATIVDEKKKKHSLLLSKARNWWTHHNVPESKTILISQPFWFKDSVIISGNNETMKRYDVVDSSHHRFPVVEVKNPTIFPYELNGKTIRCSLSPNQTLLAVSQGVHYNVVRMYLSDPPDEGTIKLYSTSASSTMLLHSRSVAKAVLGNRLVFVWRFYCLRYQFNVARVASSRFEHCS
jgi:hypothetical protein